MSNAEPAPTPAAARNRPAASGDESGPAAGFVGRGGLWVAIQMALLTAVVALGILFPGRWHCAPCGVAGAVLFVVGVASCVAGVVCLGRGLTPFPRPREAGRLVQTGIYRYVRHPLYASLVCGAFGWSLWWQSWEALAASVLLAVFLDAKARREERWLRERFPDYAGYQQRVRRFIPWVY